MSKIPLIDGALQPPFVGMLADSGDPSYKERLNRDPRWALSEGSRHFEERSAVFQALHKIPGSLKCLGFPMRSWEAWRCSVTASGGLPKASTCWCLNRI